MRKSFRLFASIIIVIGSLFFLTGIIFRIKEWPDIFNGTISGSLIIVLGIVILFLGKLFASKE